MRRVRGEFPSSKHRVTPENPHGYHGKFLGHLIGKPFVKRQGHLFDAYPRPYKTGVVGSHGEIDWSVRVSYIPVGFYLNLLTHNRELHSRLIDKTCPKHLSNIDAAHRPPKGFTYLWLTTDDQVRLWTKFANTFGIKYHNDRYYVFPKGMIGAYHVKQGTYYASPQNPFRCEKGKQEFEFLKMTGVISHKRSDFSRIRRAARRGLNVVVKPLCVSDVVGLRKCASAKERRKNFIKDETLYPSILDKRQRCHMAPETVLKAVFRLFSTVKPLEVIEIPGVPPKKEMPYSFTYVKYKPPRLGRTLQRGSAVNVFKGKFPLTASTIPMVGIDHEDADAVSIDSSLESFLEGYSSKRPGRLKRSVTIIDGKLQAPRWG